MTISVAVTISVVVISHETREDLGACLSALRGERWREAVVVDNASHDGSADMVLSEFPWISLVRNEGNPGYGAAANQGVAACTGEYVLLLNADTVPATGTGAALALYLAEHPRAALAGPRLLNPDGSLQPSCYPFLTPARVLPVMSGLNSVIRAIPPLSVRHLPTTPHDRSIVVPWVKGAALALRRSAFLEVGGFDERFFMYGEELDLAFRLRSSNWETHLAPVANVVHRERASTPAGSAAVDVHVYRSLVLFYRHHYPPRLLLALRLVTALLMSARIVRDLLHLLGAHSSAQRRELLTRIEAWRRILLGRFDEPAGREQGGTSLGHGLSA